MTTKIVYAYDRSTGAYLGETVAYADPLTPGTYLIPAGATEGQPPTAGAHQVAQWSNGAWALVADYRGWNGYKADGTAVAITTIGESPDSTWSTRPPAPSLQLAQAAQAEAIKIACAAAIVAGFTSSALGSARSYASQSTDQVNISAAAASGGSIWCADSSGAWTFAAHTMAQAAQVRSDLWAHVQACQTKYANLLAQISAATAVGTVQAVTW